MQKKYREIYAGHKVEIYCALFLLTGICITIGNQLIYYQGAGGGGFAMITVFPIYIGMVLAFSLNFLFKRRFKREDSNDKIITTNLKNAPKIADYQLQICIVSIVDFGASWCGAVGLYYAGSGIFQVLESSVVIFTAVLSSFILKKSLSILQWLAVFLVSIGLSLSALSSGSHGDHDATGEESTIYIGIVFTMLCTTLLSLTCVLDERLISKGLGAVELCVNTGLYCGLFTVVYIIIYVFPNWDELVVSQVEISHGNWNTIAVLFLSLCILSLGHSITYFETINYVGGISTGIIQSLRAVFVFFISSYFFCDSHAEQCFTFWKGLASLIVILGIIMFSMTSTMSKHIPHNSDSLIISPSDHLDI